MIGLYNNCVITLCGMVLHHAKYTQEKENHQKSDCYVLASRITKPVMKHFGLQSYAKFEKWRQKQGSDKGDEVDLESMFAAFVDQ